MMPNPPRGQNGFPGRPACGPSNNNRPQTLNPWEGGIAPGCGNVSHMSNSFMGNQNRGNPCNNYSGNPNSNFGNPHVGPLNQNRGNLSNNLVGNPNNNFGSSNFGPPNQNRGNQGCNPSGNQNNNFGNLNFESPKQNRGNRNNSLLGNPENSFGSPNFGPPNQSRGNLGNLNNSCGPPNFVPSNMGYQNQNVRNSGGGGLLPTPKIQPGPGLLPEPSVQAQLAAANNVLSLLLPHSQQQQSSMNKVNTNRGNGLLPLNPPGNQLSINSFGGPAPHGPTRSPGPHQGFVGPDQNKMAANWFQRSVTGSPGKNVGAGFNAEGKLDSRNDKTDKNKNRDSFETLKESYSDISSDLLHCHICKKKMWDANSFVKHIKGLPHLDMIKKLEENYKHQTENRRKEVQVEELSPANQHQIKQNRHLGPVSRTHCAMCNLDFVGNLTLHRRSSKHQALKLFLHPKCVECRQEFPNRIDWDHHLLSPGHLKEIQFRRGNRRRDDAGNKRGSKGTAEIANKRFKRSSQSHDCESKNESKNSKKENGPSSTVNASICDKPDVKEVTDSKLPSTETSETKTVSKPEDVETAKNDCNTSDAPSVREVSNDSKPQIDVTKETTRVKESDSVVSSPTVKNKMLEEIPSKYEPHKELGLHMLQEKTGYLCTCCNRFLSSQADSRTHCRSKFHFEKYVAYLKSKIKPDDKEVQPAEANTNKSDVRVPSSDTELQSPKPQRELQSPSIQSVPSPISNNDDEKTKGESAQEEEEEEEEDESGNWKRKKNSKDDNGETPDPGSSN